MSASGVRTAIIGAGAVNFGAPDGPWDHASRLEKLSAEIVAVVDPITDKAQAQVDKRRAGKEYGHMWTNTKIYGDVEAMLEAEKPTAVFIGVPPSFHGCFNYPIELQCLRAGAHCFIEKPLSNAPVDEVRKYSDELEQLAKEKNLVVSVGYMFRYSQFARKIEELAKNKQIVTMHCRYNCSYSNIPSPFWWNSDHCGGPIVEQATHFADLSRFLVGEANLDSVHSRSVKANLSPGTLGYLERVPGSVDETKVPEQKRVPRSHAATWFFDTGALGSLVHGALLQGQAYDADFELMGDGLRIQIIEPYSDCPKLRVLRGPSDEDEVFEFPGDDMYLTEDDEFYKAVTGKGGVIRAKYSDTVNTYALTCKIRDDALAN